MLLVDMPPGTSDVFLTVMQMLPIDGIITVSTPQDLVEMIVGKAINLAGMMNVDVLSIVENMSYYECDECKKKHEIFGESKVDEIAERYGINTTDKLPINPVFAKLCDEGKISDFNTNDILNNTAKVVKEL